MDASLLNEARKRGGKSQVWPGLLLLLALMIAVVLVSRMGPMTTNLALGMAGLTAVGTLAMTWAMSRSGKAARWSERGSYSP